MPKAKAKLSADQQAVTNLWPRDPLPTDRQIVELWRRQIVRNPDLIDDETHIWFSIWVGFVIAYARPDLATSAAYDRLGFPVEQEEYNA